MATTKVNIGSRAKAMIGYLNVDIEKHPGVNVVADFRKLKFDNLEEIRSHHLFEHFGREEAKKILRQWYDWLQSGGKLIIETPDFEGICDNFRKDKYWMTHHAYGSQESEWAFHRDGWYEDKFREVLPQLGFKVLGVRKSVSRKILPNITVIAEKI